jgi:hypothetical protein
VIHAAIEFFTSQHAEPASIIVAQLADWFSGALRSSDIDKKRSLGGFSPCDMRRKLRGASASFVRQKSGNDIGALAAYWL